MVLLVMSPWQFGDLKVSCLDAILVVHTWLTLKLSSAQVVPGLVRAGDSSTRLC